MLDDLTAVRAVECDAFEDARQPQEKALFRARPEMSPDTDMLDAVVPNLVYTVDHRSVSTSLLVTHAIIPA
jgi:hypothetical protein